MAKKKSTVTHNSQSHADGALAWQNSRFYRFQRQEMELAPQFRRQLSGAPKEVPAKKREAPEVTQKDRKPVTYTRRVLTPEEQAAHDWKLENWLGCRCEYDDLFDMCLNCIPHRQLTDLVQ